MRRGWLAPAAAALLACLAYFNALNNPFVYDDHDTVVANPSLVDLSNVKFLFLYSRFRPIVNLSYAFDRWLWGYRPLGFHLTNLALHAVVIVLLYVWVRRLLSDAGVGLGRGPGAFTAAALFAVHPMQTEAVAYVSGRSELLCGAWFLAALIVAREAIVRRSRRHGVLSIALGALAVASKEVALVLPALVLAYDWTLRPGEDDRRTRRLWSVFVPGFAVILVAGAYRALALRTAGGWSSAPLLNLMTEAIVIWRYAGLLALPLGQSIMHSVHRVTSFGDPLAWVAVAGLAAVCLGAFAVRRRAPAVAFGIFWFPIVLAPSSSIVPLTEGMAEHRVYLASAGIFIAIAAVVGWWLDVRDPARRSRLRAYAAASALIITVLCVLTVMRNQIWADPVSLWAEATAHAEGMWEPHYALADALRERGHCGDAVPEYKKVVELSSAHRDAYVNLGICLAQTGQFDEAERAFRRALEIDPRFARGYTNLGTLALVEGNAARARDFYREAIAQDPNNVLARMQLASLYEHTFHDYHAAARMCGEARLLAPSTPGVVECVERNQQLAAEADKGLVPRGRGEGGR
jgi:hypothetical protein